MAIYIVLYVFFALLALLDLLKYTREVKPYVCFFAVSLLIFVSSIRWNVGTDWYSYLDFYERIDSYIQQPELNMMERGFSYLNYIVYHLGWNYSGFLTVMAILMIGIKVRVFYEHKAIMMLLLFLYYCYFLGDIFGVRQFLAISITLFSVRYIVSRSLLAFLSCIVLASSIHITAAFFVFSYWIYPFRYSPSMLYFSLLVALILGFMDVGGMTARAVMNMVGIDSRVGDKLMQYGDDGMDTAQGNPYVSFAVGVAKRALFLPVFIQARRYVADRYLAMYTGYLNLLVFGNMIYLIFMISLPVIARLSTGFLIFEIFILAMLVITVRDKWIRLLAFGIVLLFGAFRLYNLLSVYWDLYVPFETIFAPSNIKRE
ncbi:EpsG family protein [Olivibacter sitiensis]|uniref:EpsG family protein n=1 Tax=Olivibacter sitiensis TaxID=376470 RepID=UPI000421A328|nr:EpsG family protein [Olivibacter sitiensis]